MWHLSLEPGERLPLHRHVLDYFWTATTAGRGRSLFADGRVHEGDYAPGDTKHLGFGAGESMVHDLTNVGGTTLAFVTVEFLGGANPPLDIPRRPGEPAAAGGAADGR